MADYVKHNYGDLISACDLHTVTEIYEVLPVRYNGMEDSYEVTSERLATHTLIVCGNTTYNTALLLPRLGADGCRNTYLLADAIRE